MPNGPWGSFEMLMTLNWSVETWGHQSWTVTFKLRSITFKTRVPSKYSTVCQIFWPSHPTTPTYHYRNSRMTTSPCVYPLLTYSDTYHICHSERIYPFLQLWKTAVKSFKPMIIGKKTAGKTYACQPFCQQSILDKNSWHYTTEIICMPSFCQQL